MSRRNPATVTVKASSMPPATFFCPFCRYYKVFSLVLHVIFCEPLLRARG